MTEIEALQQFLVEHPKKHLIVDLDETLFKLHLPWGEFIDHVHDLLRAHDPDFYTQHQDKEWSMWELMNAFVRHSGPQLRAELLAYAQDFETKQSAPPSAHVELVDWLKQAVSHASFSVWSSNTTATIEKILVEHELRAHCTCIVSHDMVTYTKPDPQGFQIIAERVRQQDPDAQPADFLMIGDSSADETAAGLAGIDFFKIRYFVQS